MQVDRNYGLTGGWLVSIHNEYGEHVCSLWSAK